MHKSLNSQDMNLILQAEDDMGDLWLGNFKAAKNIQALKANKIGTVISVANNIDLTYNPNDQIKHHRFNAPDSANYGIYSIFPETNELITHGLKVGNVLIHCVVGISRSATLTIAYLIMSRSWTYEQAFHFVRERRVINPNPGFIQQLITYQRDVSRDLNQSLSQRSPQKQSFTFKSEKSSPNKIQPYNLQAVDLSPTKITNPRLKPPTLPTTANKMINRGPLEPPTTQVIQKNKSALTLTSEQKVQTATFKSIFAQRQQAIPDLLVSKVSDLDFSLMSSKPLLNSVTTRPQSTSIMSIDDQSYRARCGSNPKLKSYYSPYQVDSSKMIEITEKSRIEFAKRYEAHFTSPTEADNNKLLKQVGGFDKDYLTKRIMRIGLLDSFEMSSKTILIPKNKTDVQVKKHNAAKLYKSEYKF